MSELEGGAIISRNKSCIMNCDVDALTLDHFPFNSEFISDSYTNHTSYLRGERECKREKQRAREREDDMNARVARESENMGTSGTTVRMCTQTSAVRREKK